MTLLQKKLDTSFGLSAFTRPGGCTCAPEASRMPTKGKGVAGPQPFDFASCCRPLLIHTVGVGFGVGGGLPAPDTIIHCLVLLDLVVEVDLHCTRGLK